MCVRASRFVVCILLITTSASADFVGVTTVHKDDPDTDALCTQAGGEFVFFPLTVCNVYAAFDVGADRLLNIGNADLQVWSGGNPGVFYQHLFGGDTSTSCFIPGAFPDLICDSFVTIGNKCDPGTDGSATDPDFNPDEFNNNGHIVGGWFNGFPLNGQGDAGQDPPNQNLQVLFLQSSVEQGNSMSGSINIFWRDPKTGNAVAELDVPIECATCSKDNMCDDNSACTEDTCDPASGGCTFAPINCDDGDQCTDDACDPDTGCTHENIECPKGQVCEPATGECVVDQDPCECVNGRVTLCHIPLGNLANARTITVGCAARDRHLAHGDSCGPCEDGGG